MKATIRDKEALMALDPIQLAAYLRSNNWHEQEQIPEKASIWVKKTRSGEEYEILLPLSTRFKDFPIRLAEILKTLEFEEQRAQIEILESLKNLSSDIISLRITDPDYSNGNIPLNAGVNLHRYVRELILSRACSTVEAKPYFERRKPVQANRYINNVRLGQSKIGSYILTIISPINTTQEYLFETEPFERKVIAGLSKALSFVLEFSESVRLDQGNFSFSEEIIQNGVNANLCEALLGIYKSGNQNDLEIDFNFSSIVSVPQNLQKKIIFSSRLMPTIERLSKKLKAAFYENFEVRGEVFRLERQTSDMTGKVIILAPIEDKQRKVQVELYEDAYQLAATAHQERRTVTCRGELVQEGRVFRLDNPRNFKVLG